MKRQAFIRKAAFFHVASLRPKSPYRTAILRHAVGMPEIRPLSPFPATRTFFSINLSTNICLLFKSLLRAYFDFRTKTQRPSPPLHPKVQRRTSLNTPLKDLFFARKSYHFYVPKMSLKNANGCSVCAWLLTSGGLRLPLRLTPQRHPRASPSAETPKGAPSTELQATPSRGRRPSAHTHTNKSPLNRSNFIA